MGINKKKRNIVSLFLTLVIISLLILSGPVSAIRLAVQTDKDIYTSSDESVTFTVTINLETSEQVPLKNVTLDINATTGNVSLTCIFTPDGSELSGCTNIDILNATVNTPYSNNSGYAYGYGYSSVNSAWDNITTNWGYNYGYGFGLGNANAGTEFTYTIRWNYTAADAGDGTYAAFIDAIASNSTGDYYIFRSDEASFAINSAIANNIPEFKQNLAARTATEDVAFTYRINATDADNDVLMFSHNSTKFSAADFAATNRTSATINFTPVSGQQGRQEIKVTVTDGNSGSVSQNFNLTINSADDLPVLVLPSRELTAIKGQSSTYIFTATDEEGGTLLYSINQSFNGSIGLTMASTTGRLVFDGTAAVASRYLVEIMAYQQNNSAKNDTETVYLTVLAAGTENQAPSFYEWNVTKNNIVQSENSSTMTLTAGVNDTIAYRIVFSDANGNSTAAAKWYAKGSGETEYTYSGITINTYTVPPNSLASGAYNIKAVVSDGLADVSKIWTLTLTPFQDADGDNIEDSEDTCPLDITNTCGADKDSDGVTNDDYLVGNSTIIETNIPNFGVEVAGSTNLSQNFSGIKRIEFTTKVQNQSSAGQELTVDVVSFNWTFGATGVLNLTDVYVEEDSRIAADGSTIPYVVVHGLDLQAGVTKTISVSYLSNPSMDSVCVYDQEAYGIVQVSEDCSGTNEIKVLCSTSGSTFGAYTCTKNTQTGRMEVSGLTHSAVQLITGGSADEETEETTTTSSGGGAVTKSVDYYGAQVSQGWWSIESGDTIEMSINDGDIPVTSIVIVVNKALANVKLSVVELIDDPKGMVNLTGKIYKYFEVSKENIANVYISSVTITFRVPKSWFGGISESDISLYRFSGGAWEELKTTKTMSDSTYVYYTAQTKGLSFFAVGKKDQSVKPLTEITGNLSVFQIIDAIRAFYEGSSKYSAFQIIDIIRAFYGS